MISKKIKVVKTTPFDEEGTLLTIEEFRLRYGYICAVCDSDEELVDYIQTYTSHPALRQTKQFTVSEWFKVEEIPVNRFEIGDWIWHEIAKKAFIVKKQTMGKDWNPNYVSFEAANELKETFKRKATEEEIKHYNLVEFCAKTVLIGPYKCYYWNNEWKQLSGIRLIITKYLNFSKELLNISTLTADSATINTTFVVRPSGLQVGCRLVTHSEILLIAKELCLIP